MGERLTMPALMNGPLNHAPVRDLRLRERRSFCLGFHHDTRKRLACFMSAFFVCFSSMTWFSELLTLHLDFCPASSATLYSQFVARRLAMTAKERTSSMQKKG